jgi:hypothetical protein
MAIQTAGVRNDLPAPGKVLPPLGEFGMANSNTTDAPPEDGRIPFMQRLLDNHFLLLFLGVTIPTVLYIIWGIMEVTQIPIAP